VNLRKCIACKNAKKKFKKQMEDMDNGIRTSVSLG
jgi:hypothetical protein